MIRSKQDDTTTTSRLLVECLENEGVQYIFGIPGEENLELISELKDSKIKFITTRHEQGAAFMADVYGRLTGHAGVCLATLGPGATNLATGVADANGDGAPLIAITGQVGTERMHITSHQYMDLTKFFEPITKRTKMVVRPDTINEIVRIAFKYAESERPGACHIDIPVNISKMKFSASERPLKRELPFKEKAVDRSISEAAKLISQASNPIILAGSQAIRVHASKALTRFAEDLKIPVVNTMMAKGIIPYDNKYAMMTVGIPQCDHANKLLVDADLIVAIGYDLVEFSPFRWNQDNNAKIVHISTTPAHINKYYQCDVEVIGDISDALNRIVDELNGENRNEPENALKIRKAFDDSFEKDARNDNFPMTPHRIISDVRKALGRKDILISDVGAHKMWIARLYHCYEPNTCIISNGFATMGIGLPGAVSAKLVHPERRILTVTGDGGFMMNSQELETAVRLKLNIVVLIMNDSSYGLIKWKQMDQYGETYFTDFTNPDFVKLAESMNCIGYRVTKASDLSELLEKAFHQDCPVIIDVPADYSENVKLSQKLKKWREKLVSNRMRPEEKK